MGTYFNPPKEIPNVGRRLSPLEKFANLVEALEPDEVLVGYYMRTDLPFNNAVVLFDEDEYRVFEKQAKDGDVVREGFYAVKKDAVGFGGQLPEMGV